MNAKASKNKSQNKNKKAILTIISIIVIVIIVILVSNATNKKNNENNEEKESYVVELEDGINLNKSTKLNEAKTVNGLVISNIQLTEKGGITTLLADVTNKTQEKTELKKLKITLLDENGEELASIVGFVNELNPEQTTQLNCSTTSNYVEAYDFKVDEY